jgi:hypothetical protein
MSVFDPFLTAHDDEMAEMETGLAEYTAVYPSIILFVPTGIDKGLQLMPVAVVVSRLPR